MKKLLLLALLTLSLFADTAPPPKAHEAHEVQQVDIGMYIDDVWSLSPDSHTYHAMVWVWSVSDSNYTMENLEVVNAVSVKTLFKFDEIVDGMYWTTKKMDIELVHKWDLRSYPLDKQQIEIIFEDADNDSNQLKFKYDCDSSLSSALRINGWIVDTKRGIKGEVIDKQIDTTFGDPSLNSTDSFYSRATFSLEVDRDTNRGVLTVFLPIIMSFFIAWLGYWINRDFAIKTTLFLSSLFLLIGSKTIIDKKLMGYSGVTLVDYMQGLSFLGIFLFLGTIIYSLRSVGVVTNERMQYINERLAVIIGVSYLLAFAWLLVKFA